MTKTYVAKRLLEHGPLTFAQFREITGWLESTCSSTLAGLVETGIAIAERYDGRKYLYRLA